MDNAIKFHHLVVHKKVQFFIYIEYKNGSVLSLENLAEFLFSGNDYIL